jgi:peptidoglycan/LPS O-acetylase OafA/YrhL
MKYRAEIDGLRTVAVIPVILFHLGYSFVKGGFYGVDVFFVISGYLITKILTENIENENFSMFKFWIRRIKRLLPLLLIVVLVTLIFAYFFVFKPVVKDISKDIFPAIFSYFNFHALYDFGNYWGGDSKQSFFLHTWSLSVEEQFYLIYPLFLYFFYRYFKNFFVPIFIITILSYILFFYFLKINYKVDVAFYILPTRMWELSFGGLIGLINVQKIKTIINYNLLPLIGIGFILCSYLSSSKGISNLAILPVLGSGLIILYSTPNDIIGKILSSNFFVLIGKLSYSLYLWHWPIIVLFKNFDCQLYDVNKHIINILIVLITFLLSYITYYFIENKTRNYIHTPKIVLVGIVIISCITLYFQSQSFSVNYNSPYNQIANYGNYNISPQQDKTEFVNDSLGQMFIRLSKFDNAYKEEGITHRIENKNPELLLIGDSHGFVFARLLDEISTELKVSNSFYTFIGAKPFFNIKEIDLQESNSFFTVKQKQEYAQSILSNINKWLPKVVIICCRWENITEKEKMYFQQLLELLEDKKIKVLLFTQPPLLDFGNKNVRQYITYLGISPASNGELNLMRVKNISVTKQNNYIKSLASKYSNVSVYDVCENMIEKDRVKISIGKDVLYFDDDHLSYQGTLLHRNTILQLIKESVKNDAIY